MAVVLDIHVPGIPQQQGSKTPWGSDANEAKLKPWRAAVQEAAKEAFTGTQLLREAVFLDVVYTYPRRKSHYRTGRNAHLLREDAPDFKTSAPDRDKLLRATQDALTGVVMYDDSYIVGGCLRRHPHRASHRRLSRAGSAAPGRRPQPRVRASRRRT